ncbi:hypothetical protein JMJ77_0014620 [Colletotrichum scovillei]|uniref:Uncharacterized protein n=1 Tax=Colletotrichum scovillei TaxID=1209932 RepID=A0A9P7U9N2_9PEZI|nr:hypothetical protein JMJ77_0014620 [Colletotrichum scovillei]KAG7056229.1 hypothetical protein JMJ78_0000033 [Colletotrichum scovillei]KAG7066158.1 hypothetical protein JMJ76_0000026 [Colletotrichum scovillei]
MPYRLVSSLLRHASYLAVKCPPKSDTPRVHSITYNGWPHDVLPIVYYPGPSPPAGQFNFTPVYSSQI